MCMQIERIMSYIIQPKRFWTVSRLPCKDFSCYSPNMAELFYDTGTFKNKQWLKKLVTFYSRSFSHILRNQEYISVPIDQIFFQILLSLIEDVINHHNWKNKESLNIVDRLIIVFFSFFFPFKNKKARAIQPPTPLG